MENNKEKIKEKSNENDSKNDDLNKLKSIENIKEIPNANKKINSKSKRDDELLETLKGFLIFTDKNREKNSLRDAYNILNDTVEEIYPNVYNELEIKTNDIKNNNIDHEIENIKKRNKIFFNFEIKCKGVVFIKIDKEYKNLVEPNEVMFNIIQKILQTKQQISKNISKFIPIEIACKAKFEIIKENVNKLIEKYFINKDSTNKVPYTIEFRYRNNNSINKNQYLNAINDLINKDFYYVNYKHPKLTVLVEISHDLCCLSILNNYFEYKYYNIQTLCKSEDELNKEREKLVNMQNKRENEKKKKNDESLNKNDKNKTNFNDAISDIDEEDVDII